MLNVRDSFLPGENSRWVWEQTKRQIYKMLFHRIVSLETKRTLEDILSLVLYQQTQPDFSVRVNMAKLFSPEFSIRDILGYKNSFKLAIEEESAREGLLWIQKMFDKKTFNMEDEEERVARLILDEPIKLKEDEKEKEEEGQASQVQSSSEKSLLQPIDKKNEELEYQKELELEAQEFTKANREEHQVIDLILNKTVLALREKLTAIDNCIDVCSMVVTDNPDSFLRS